MQSIFQQAVRAVVPVVATVASIATLSAGGIRFPMALELFAWPHWAILASLVFTYSTIGFWVAPKASAGARPLAPSPRSAA